MTPSPLLHALRRGDTGSFSPGQADNGAAYRDTAAIAEDVMAAEELR